jgi:adenylate cyclase class 2
MAKSSGERTLEVEVKGKVKDLKSVEAKAKALGFSFVGVEEHSDIYYRHPTRDFAKTDEAIRVRTVNGKRVLTYKGPKVDKVSKTREEIEVDIQGDMPKVLERLGFSPVTEVAKVRRVYKKGDIEVCLDDVRDVGTYVEVECRSTDLVATRTRVLDVVKALGLKDKDLERNSYLQLLLAKR